MAACVNAYVRFESNCCAVLVSVKAPAVVVSARVMSLSQKQGKGSLIRGEQSQGRNHEKPVLCQVAIPPPSVEPTGCQSIVGLEAKASAPDAAAAGGTGMRIVTGRSKTMSCGVNSYIAPCGA